MDEEILVVDVHLIEQIHVLLLEEYIWKGLPMVFADKVECHVVREIGTQVHALQLILDRV